MNVLSSWARSELEVLASDARFDVRVLKAESARFLFETSAVEGLAELSLRLLNKELPGPP